MLSCVSVLYNYRYFVCSLNWFNTSVGDDVQSDIIESAAAFLFTLCHNKQQMTSAESDEIRQKLGPHSPKQADAVHALVIRYGANNKK